MIYLTGDKHGDRSFFESSQDSELHPGDFLIICGDFGYLFGDTPREHQFLDWLEAEKPYTILFVDGNHENFDALAGYPVDTWHGGQIHRLRRNILHLMRGQVFTIEGRTFFTMGGGYSRDRKTRIKNLSYWDAELPSAEEYAEALANLYAHNNTVDYIISHTIPTSIIPLLGRTPDPHEEELNRFFETLLHTVTFKHWWAGHWHQNNPVTPKLTVLYYKLQRLV